MRDNSPMCGTMSRNIFRATVQSTYSVDSVRLGGSCSMLFGPVTKLFGDVSRLLRRLRNHADMTQEQAAAELGLKKQSISRYESEKAPVYPSLEVFDQLMTIYGIASLRELEAEVGALRDGNRSGRAEVNVLEIEERNRLVDIFTDYIRLKKDEDDRKATEARKTWTEDLSLVAEPKAEYDSPMKSTKRR